ncbi:hypothetical protein EBT31_12110 [bacterium]|nr:hypothetical protein [bacterium]
MRRALAIVSIATLSLAACGSDDKSPTDTVATKNLIMPKPTLKKIPATTTSTLVSKLGGEETDGVAPLGGEETDGVAPLGGEETDGVAPKG